MSDNRLRASPAAPRPETVPPCGNATNSDAPSKSLGAEARGKLVIDGTLPLAVIAEVYGRGIAGSECDPMAMLEKMTETARGAISGDLSDLESMLSAQAQTLNIMFAELARRAGVNMGGHPHIAEMYLRQALKAQAQSRATVEALAEIKNPRSVAFVRTAQANISNGPQQVNNGAPVARAGAKDQPKSTNELLEEPTHEQEQRMVPGAQAAPARGDPTVETVDAIDRADDSRR